MKLNVLNSLNEDSVLHNITITDNAAKQIILLSSTSSNIKGVRLRISHSGCAGLTYQIELVRIIIRSDLKFCHMGAVLYISLSDIKFINGIEIDYVIDTFNSMFVFKNPNALRFCGCGRSFNI